MPTKYRVSDIKKSKAAKGNDNGNLATEINKVIPLHKVGINWFGRCLYCGDVGSHFLVPHHGRYWQCLLCNRKGVTSDLPGLPARQKFEF